MGRSHCLQGNAAQVRDREYSRLKNQQLFETQLRRTVLANKILRELISKILIVEADLVNLRSEQLVS